MIRFLKHIALPIALGFLGLFQFSCRKTYSELAVPFVFNSSPVKEWEMELNTNYFLPLSDNTFIISVKSTAGSNLRKSVFLHYDEKFKLIDSTYYLNSLYFGKGIAHNNTITNVFLRYVSYVDLAFYLIETDYNYETKNQSYNLLDNINLSAYAYLDCPQIIQLSNGTLVTAITTGVPNVHEKLEPKSVFLSAFNQGIHSAPLWKNDSIYSIYSIYNIEGKVLVDMASDGNFFYVLCKNYTGILNSALLRKHDENGNLIWVTPVPENCGEQILVQNDKVILFGQGLGMQVFDKDGKLISSNLQTDFNLLSTGNNGYLGLDLKKTRDYPFTYKNVVTKYNPDFGISKSRFFGDGLKHNSVLGKLNDGSFVLVMSVNKPEYGEMLVFYRLDAELNDYYN